MNPEWLLLSIAGLALIKWRKELVERFAFTARGPDGSKDRASEVAGAFMGGLFVILGLVGTFGDDRPQAGSTQRNDSSLPETDWLLVGIGVI